MKYPIFLLSIVLFLSACQSWPPKSAFYAQRYDEALSECQKKIAENPTGKDYAYHRLFFASVAFSAGKYEEANRALREALKVMESYGEDGTKELLALIGSEEGKVYKGDPYEKMMAHYYTGLTFYFLGDYPKALAGFKNALGADLLSPEEIYKRDCLLVLYLAAKTSLILGESEGAGVFLREARQHETKNPAFEWESVKKNNLTILVEMGRAPYKRAVGPGESIEVLEEIDFVEDSVEIFLDGESLGKAYLLADIPFQAKTCGRSKASSLREAKGVAGDIAMGLPLVQSKADTRAWTFLPGKIMGLSHAVKAGNHTLLLKFYDREGLLLPAYEQSLPISVSQNTIVCVRSGKK